MSIEENLLKLSADFRNWCEKVTLVPPEAWMLTGLGEHASKTVPSRTSIARAARSANAPSLHAPDQTPGLSPEQPADNIGEAVDESGFERHDDILVRYFSQAEDFPWMHLKVAARDRGREVSRFPFTEEGVCAALTCHYMRMHAQGADAGFFDWIKTPGGHLVGHERPADL